MVTISNNGVYNGEVGIDLHKYVISEDGTGEVFVNVTRTGNSIEDIQVSHLFDFDCFSIFSSFFCETIFCLIFNLIFFGKEI